jgi:flagellar biogenesis protein FliO
VRTTSICAAVVVGIAIAIRMARKFIPGLGQLPGHRVIQVLSRSQLGGKGSIYLVRCGPRVLIIGATANQFTTLAEIADPDEIDEYIRLSGANDRAQQSDVPAKSSVAPTARQLKGQVDGMLEKLDNWKT